MKLFVVREHDGVWLPGCSVIVAEDEVDAKVLLDAELVERHLCLDNGTTDYYEIEELSLDKAAAYVLFDGSC